MNNNNTEVKGWGEWSRWVLKNIEKINERLDSFPSNKEIERLSQDIEKLEQQLHNLEVKLTAFEIEFKIRSGIWGAIGAAIPVIGFFIIKYLTG